MLKMERAAMAVIKILSSSVLSECIQHWARQHPNPNCCATNHYCWILWFSAGKEATWPLLNQVFTGEWWFKGLCALADETVQIQWAGTVTHKLTHNCYSPKEPGYSNISPRKPWSAKPAASRAGGSKPWAQGSAGNDKQLSPSPPSALHPVISGYLARHTFPREILVCFTIPPSSVLPWEPRQIFLLECKTIWHFSGEGLLLELHFLLVILPSPTLLCWISVCLQILPMTWADLPFNLCLSSCSIGLSSHSQNSGLLAVKPRNLHSTI